MELRCIPPLSPAVVQVEVVVVVLPVAVPSNFSGCSLVSISSRSIANLVVINEWGDKNGIGVQSSSGEIAEGTMIMVMAKKQRTGTPTEVKDDDDDWYPCTGVEAHKSNAETAGTTGHEIGRR